MPDGATDSVKEGEEKCNTLDKWTNVVNTEVLKRDDPREVINWKYFLVNCRWVTDPESFRVELISPTHLLQRSCPCARKSAFLGMAFHLERASVRGAFSRTSLQHLCKSVGAQLNFRRCCKMHK